MTPANPDRRRFLPGRRPSPPASPRSRGRPGRGPAPPRAGPTAGPDRHLGQPARRGPERRPRRGDVDPGLLGRPVRDLPRGDGPQPLAGHGGDGAEPVLSQLPDRGRGLAEGRHRGPGWNDGDFYKWLEAAAAVFAVTKDAALDRRMDEVIGVIARAQRGDGYLHTPVLIAQPQRRPRRAAVPGPPRLRDVQPRPPDDRRLRPPPGHRQGEPAAGRRQGRRFPGRGLPDADRPSSPANAVCPSHYMGIVELYRTTRDPRYLDLARTLIDLRDLVDGRHRRQPGPHPLPPADRGRRPRRPGQLPLRRRGRRLRRDRRPDPARPPAEDLGRRRLPEDVRHRGLRGPLRRRLARRLEGPEVDHPGPPGVRPRLPVAQQHGPQRDLRRRSATCSGTGGCSRSPARPGSPTSWSSSSTTPPSPASASTGPGSSTRTRSGSSTRCRSTSAGRGRGEPFISCFCCPPNLVRTIAEVGELRLRPVGRRGSGSTSTAAAPSTPRSPAAPGSG